MTMITVKLTAKELDLLTSLASDQLFRREFIDPRLPGFKANSGEVAFGKALVERLRLLVYPGSAKKPVPAKTNGSTVQKPVKNGHA